MGHFKASTEAKVGIHRAGRTRPGPGVRVRSGIEAREETLTAKCMQRKDQDGQRAGDAGGPAGTQMPEDQTGTCKSGPAGPGGGRRWSPTAKSLLEGPRERQGLKDTPRKEWGGSHCPLGPRVGCGTMDPRRMGNEHSEGGEVCPWSHGYGHQGVSPR